MRTSLELRYAGGAVQRVLGDAVDHATKVVVGWAIGTRKTTEVALQAWERAKPMLATCAGTWQGMIVHHDQDRCPGLPAGTLRSRAYRDRER